MVRLVAANLEAPITKPPLQIGNKAILTSGFSLLGMTMESWVRYSVAAYLGLMLAGTLIVPGPSPAAQLSSAPPALESSPNYWRQAAPCRPVANPPADDEADPNAKAKTKKMTQQEIFSVTHSA